MSRSSDNQSVINWIMLRFRPIAPKPVGGEAAFVASEQERRNGAWRRPKRKYVKVRGRQGKQCVKTKVKEGGNKSPPLEISAAVDFPSPEKFTVTLQLLPEGSETEEKSCDNSARNKPKDLDNADRSNVGDGVSYGVTTSSSGGAAANLRTAGSVIETLIIVERVTDRFTDEVGLGLSDMEKIYSLEKDTCPCFISDLTNNVIWVNEAYKKMVSAKDGEMGAAAEGFLVWLVVKDELPRFYPSFACRVRVIQQRVQGQKWNKIVPCDVWRMEFGRFAWKLDIKTALGLSL